MGVEGLMLVTVLLFETELMKTQLLEYSGQPLTPMSDQGRIFPHNTNTTSSRQVMRITKNC